jgi:hypothetical protein
MAEKKMTSKKKVRIDDLPKTQKRAERVSNDQADKVKGGVGKIRPLDDPTRYGG